MSYTMTLPVDLTDKELLEIGQTHAQKQHELEQQEERKKEANRGYNGAIKILKAAIHGLTETRLSRVAKRPVAVESYPDPNHPGKMLVKRLDTGELVNMRDIEDGDRQLEIPSNGKSATVTPIDSGRAAKRKAHEEGEVEEEQTADSPEEGERIREEKRAADEIDGIVAAIAEHICIDAIGRVATVEVAIPGLAVLEETGTDDADGRDRLVESIRRHVLNNLAAYRAAAEVERLAAEQGPEKPRALLKPPKGKKGKRASTAKSAKRLEAEGRNPVTGELPEDDADELDQPTAGGNGSVTAGWGDDAITVPAAGDDEKASDDDLAF